MKIVAFNDGGDYVQRAGLSATARLSCFTSLIKSAHNCSAYICLFPLFKILYVTLKGKLKL